MGRMRGTEAMSDLPLDRSVILDDTTGVIYSVFLIEEEGTALISGRP